MYVFTIEALKAVLTALKTTPGELFAAELQLFSEDAFPSRASVVGDFTPITAGGLTDYTAITWGSVFVNGNQAAEVAGAALVFQPSTLTNLPITAHGYAIVNAAHDKVIVAERFDNPITFTSTDDQFAMVPRVVLNT